ncbi:MAG: hypothetical protein ACM3UP_00640 [Methanocella sp.]
MALHLYFDAAHANQVSEGSNANPWTDRYNGTTGETKQVTLYLWNDASATRTYKAITLGSSGDTAAIDLEFSPNGSTGWVESLSLADGDYATAAPVYVRCVVAAGTGVQNFAVGKITVSAEEEAK